MHAGGARLRPPACVAPLGAWHPPGSLVSGFPGFAGFPRGPCLSRFPASVPRLCSPVFLPDRPCPHPRDFRRFCASVSPPWPHGSRRWRWASGPVDSSGVAASARVRWECGCLESLSSRHGRIRRVRCRPRAGGGSFESRESLHMQLLYMVSIIVGGTNECRDTRHTGGAAEETRKPWTRGFSAWRFTG